MLNFPFLNLDINKKEYFVFECKQNDDLTLEVNIFENGLSKDLTSSIVTIKAIRKDETFIIQNTDIAISKNKIIAYLVKDFTKIAGNIEIELMIVDGNNKKKTTFEFELNVIESVISETVENDNTLTILEKLDEKTLEAKKTNDETSNLNIEADKNINTLKELIPEVGKLDNSIKEKLEEYAANEGERKSKENERNTKETERITNENERISNENLRKSNEEIRITSEEERKSKEEDRETKETKRINSEKTRGEAETSRNNNENSRKISESTRSTNEEERKAKENERVSAETNRVNIESTRVLAEETRVKNEAERQLKEQDRLNAEEERKANEITRETAYEEITGAREDYFGEGHNDLQERLNSDFDNIHQRVNESSLLPYSGTNITANNSYYGLIEDLAINGRTLQNLCEGNDISPITQYLYKKELKNIKNSTNYTICFKLSNVVKGGYTNQFSLSIENIPQMPSRGIPFENGVYNVLITTKDSTLLDTTLPIYINFWTQYIDVGQTYQISEVMILEGDYTNENISFFEGIKSVGENEVTEDGKYKVNVKSCGKNLINPKKCSLKFFYEDTIREGNYPTAEFKAEVGKTYSVNTESFYAIIVDENYTYLSTANRDENKLTVNHNGICMIRYHQEIGAEGSPYKSLQDFINMFQVEEGTSVTEYEPYKETTQEYLLDEPLRGLPNGVCNSIDSEGTYTKKIEKVILDGSEDWINLPAQNLTNTLIFRWYNEKVSNADALTGKNIISDKFPSLTPLLVWEGYDYEGIGPGSVSGEGITVRVLRSNLETQDVEGFKTWLKDNPTTVYYETSTPITKTFKNTMLYSQEDTTHIMSDNLLAPTISCKISSNVPAVISSLRLENEGLNNEVEILTIENENLSETNDIQDKTINVSLLATDEIYSMLEPILGMAAKISTLEVEEVSKMVDLYVVMIQRGLKKIEDVPERYREQVRAILEELEK